LARLDRGGEWSSSIVVANLKPVSANPQPCKICGGAAALFGVVDFHKSCLEVAGKRLAPCGIPIYYRRCPACEFLFTDAFDDWTADEFKLHVYNKDYHVLDPDYQSRRPQANAGTVVRLWGQAKSALRVLDYGGGNDAFCAALRLNGFPVATTYDPMTPAHARPPDGRFDLVTCFEALEHTTDPVGEIGRIVEFVAEPGLVLFTTLVQPANFAEQGVNWWYVAPRNGHISLFSRKALAAAWGRYGYKLGWFDENLHIAFRELPPFAANLVK
jgi:2-polyprenyl-6-hydroxyphenyl methylase/3-demethylubiquinone-9 3-methyltransferase